MVNNSSYVEYIISLVKTLSKDYDSILLETEPFVRWNLPEEIGMEWIDAFDMGILSSFMKIGSIPNTTKNLVLQIYNNFNDAFEIHCIQSVWTHESMKKSDFWDMQRALARAVLENTIEPNKDWREMCHRDDSADTLDRA